MNKLEETHLLATLKAKSDSLRWEAAHLKDEKTFSYNQGLTKGLEESRFIILNVIQSKEFKELGENNV